MLVRRYSLDLCSFNRILPLDDAYTPRSEAHVSCGVVGMYPRLPVAIPSSRSRGDYHPAISLGQSVSSLKFMVFSNLTSPTQGGNVDPGYWRMQ
jgi:hypothetical protein